MGRLHATPYLANTDQYLTMYKDVINECTTNKCWVCVIEGRFLKSAKGRCGWATKAAATLAFKSSPYWSAICQNMLLENVDDTCVDYLGRKVWKSRSIGKKMEDAKYKELVDSGVVHIYQISIAPEWVK